MKQYLINISPRFLCQTTGCFCGWLACLGVLANLWDFVFQYMDGGGLVKIESKTGQTIATSHPKGSFLEGKSLISGKSRLLKYYQRKFS